MGKGGMGMVPHVTDIIALTSRLRTSSSSSSQQTNLTCSQEKASLNKDWSELRGEP